MFVLASGARLEALQPALDAELNAGVVTDVEVQEWALLARAPVAAEQSPRAHQVEGAAERLPGSFFARQHHQHLLGHARTDLVEEIPIQVAPAVEVLVHGGRVKLVN